MSRFTIVHLQHCGTGDGVDERRDVIIPRANSGIRHKKPVTTEYITIESNAASFICILNALARGLYGAAPLTCNAFNKIKKYTLSIYIFYKIKGSFKISTKKD